MPPRFAYWTILVGGLPTAFRAAEREEIEPTFRRLQEKHPDAEMRWFARGKLWASPAEATAALRQRSADADRQSRDRTWRPGGTHRDPRQPYKDAKKRDNQKRRERRFEFKNKGSGPQAPGSRPHEERPKWDKPHRPLPKGTGPQTPGSRPENARPKWTRPPGEKPAWKLKPKPWRAQEPGARGQESRDHRPLPTGPQSPGSRRQGEKPWKPKPWQGPKTEDRRPKTWEQRPKWKGARPQVPGSRPHGEQPKWKKPLGEEKPQGEKPWKPKPWQGPKTEDRRPKTGSGPGPARGHWSGPPKGPRKGPRGPR